MNDYNFTIPPLVAEMQPVTIEEAKTLATGFLEALGLEQPSLELTLLVHFIAVFRVKGIDLKTGRNRYGWVVGGHLPHLELSDAEIQTPLEALAIYALYLHTWIDAKGVPDAGGKVPVYRVPPDWEPLSYSPGYEQWRMGAITSYIAWNLIPRNSDHVIHPDIRAKCSNRGWNLSGDWHDGG